jgi:hypothetical protein
VAIEEELELHRDVSDRFELSFELRTILHGNCNSLRTKPLVRFYIGVVSTLEKTIMHLILFPSRRALNVAGFYQSLVILCKLESQPTATNIELGKTINL